MDDWRRDRSRARRSEIAALLKAYPNATPVRALNGALKASKKDFAGARGEYERALQLDANSLEALTGLVMLDLTQKNMAAARARVETRLATQPNRSELLSSRRPCLRRGEGFWESRGACCAISSRSIRRIWAGYAMLGQVYLAQAEAGPGESRSSRSERAPIRRTHSSRLVVAMILEMQKKVPEAKQKYDEVLAINPRSVDCRKQPCIPVCRGE